MKYQDHKESLLRTKSELEQEISQLGKKINEQGDWVVFPDESDGTFADPVDNADITEDYEEKLAVARVLEGRLSQVLRALHSLDAGTYGVCEVCGEEIPENRLAANPAATTCVEHAPVER